MKKLRRTFTPGTFDLRVRRSRTGRGLFTRSAIPKGACIIEYRGKKATKKQQKENTGKYLFWTSDTTMIDGNIPGNIARFVNHSCVPNCEVDIKDRRIYIFAKRRIKPGEELTYDYGDEYYDMHLGPHICQCPSCRKKQKN